MLTAKGLRNPEPAGRAGPRVRLDHQAEVRGAGLGKRDLLPPRGQQRGLGTPRWSRQGCGCGKLINAL